MKITGVEIIRSYPQKGKPKWRPAFVRIHTDAGIDGLGEIGLAYGTAQDAGVGQAQDFARMLLGKDPLRIEAIWDMFHRKTFWGMSGGAVCFAAMSAIDIALWDIKGKYMNQPVYQLLGGKTNEKIRGYASQIQNGWKGNGYRHIQPEEYAQAARDAIAAGFDAVKVDPIGIDPNGGWMDWNTRGILSKEQLDVAEARVAAIREVGGEGLDIIVELHALTDTNTAIQLGRRLEQYNVYYLEEPTQPLNDKLFGVIAREVKMPLAAGERIHSRWGFRPFFEERSLSIIQPDLCNCGGITEGKKICDMAHVYDIGVQLHVCGSPVSNAAALQVEAVIPNFVIHEVHEYAIEPYNIELCKYDYQPVNGYYSVPDLPGIGQELTEKAVKEAEIYINIKED